MIVVVVVSTVVVVVSVCVLSSLPPHGRDAIAFGPSLVEFGRLVDAPSGSTPPAPLPPAGSGALGDSSETGMLS